MHIHISAISGLVTVLYVIAIMSLLNWVAMKYAASNKLAAAYCNLWGLNY